MTHRVLIVEDDAAVRELATLVAADRGINIVHAPDLATARAGLETLWDLVILDLDLPDGNGFELLEELRAEERFSHTRVVVLTGSDRDPQEGYGRGANAWLQKPQDAGDLEARIGHAFDILG